jgi:hypothetical protein
VDRAARLDAAGHDQGRTSIEQRDSGWVVVTSGKRVLAITP